ncbi:MAG: class I SAM-dependent methyltransferase [Alphaproteobacteria bacterium]|nr:class I SAM-dependent methyltransferase [Alphaproteobacteria bacterium]
MTASHLQFYTAHKISPVRQDISDLKGHFERREALYRHLGILPAFIGGRRVLEVGPGGGFNALYTAALSPSHYTLVDGNPTGIEHMKELFAKYPEWTRDLEIVLSRLEDYKPTQAYDFVFCEGLLSGVPNADEVLTCLGSFTAPGGVLVITCVDHLSHFPETIRRVFAQLAVSPKDDLATKTAKILPMMEPHLRTLGGMNRRHDDWVIDNLIHPGSIIPLINTPEAVTILGERFEHYAGSPHFVQDWRWYKSLAGEGRAFSAPAVEQYWANAHNLFDYRRVLPPRSPAANQALYQLCTHARRQVELFEVDRERKYIDAFCADLEKIAADARDYSPELAEAVSEAERLIRPKQIDPQAVANAKKFAPLFGRGQQYVSFSKRA